MAGFSRRGQPNMYGTNIAGLNTIPTPADYDLALQQQQQEGYNMTSDLDLFTNAQFFDFDMGEMPAQSPTNFSEIDPFSLNHSLNQLDGTNMIFLADITKLGIHGA